MGGRPQRPVRTRYRDECGTARGGWPNFVPCCQLSKGEAFFDEATECPIATYKARGDRISFVANLAFNWTNLRRTAASERQVALVVANYPNKDGRLANGVGLDTPASAIYVLRHMQQAGYDVQDLPVDSADLMAQVMAGPTNWLTDRADRIGGETLSLAHYLEQYQSLPYALRTRIEERWGGPRADPFFEPNTATAEGGFKLSILRFGNVTLGCNRHVAITLIPLKPIIRQTLCHRTTI